MYKFAGNKKIVQGLEPVSHTVNPSEPSKSHRESIKAGKSHRESTKTDIIHGVTLNAHGVTKFL